MPIRYTDDPAALDAVQPNNVPEQYIIFFSSRGEDGGLWCPVRALSLHRYIRRVLHTAHLCGTRLAHDAVY